MHTSIPSNSFEILYCRSSFPKLSNKSAVGADGQAVSLWNDNDLAPPKARELCRCALETLAKGCNIDASRFTTSIQTRQADISTYPGKVYGGVVLLLKADDSEQGLVDSLRGKAMEFSRLLGEQVRLLGHTSNASTDNASVSNLTLDDLVSPTFLGMPIPVAMVIDIPGLDSWRLERRFRRRSKKILPEAVQLTVTGKLRGLKVGGRTNQLFVNGRHAEKYLPFGNHPILFNNSYLDQLSRAVAMPGIGLKLSLTEQLLDEGREKLRVQYILTGLELMR